MTYLRRRRGRTIRGHLRVTGEFLVGPSTGGGFAMVRRLADRGELGGDDAVVVMCCDRGDRYDESLWADRQS